jgi:hypothetical protein
VVVHAFECEKHPAANKDHQISRGSSDLQVQDRFVDSLSATGSAQSTAIAPIRVLPIRNSLSLNEPRDIAPPPGPRGRAIRDDLTDSRHCNRSKIWTPRHRCTTVRSRWHVSTLGLIDD